VKKLKWNTIVFLGYLAYCVLFLCIYWFVFDSNELFEKYYDLTVYGLVAAFGINTLAQFYAIIVKKDFTTRWLVLGIAMFFLTFGFSIGQGV
jgi:hypothetical protein